MTALKLIPASEGRSQGPWSDNDFDVMMVESGERIGRIYARTTPSGTGLEWFWTLGFPHTLNARPPFYGEVESKAAAKRAFAERWRG